MAVEILKNERQDQVTIDVNIYGTPGLSDYTELLVRFSSSFHFFLSLSLTSPLHVTVPKNTDQSEVLCSLTLSNDEFPSSHVFGYYLHSNVCLVCLPSFYVALGSGTSWNVLNDIGQCISKSPHDGSLASLGCTESSYPLLQVGGGRSTSNKALILLIEYLSIRSLLIYWYLFVFNILKS